MQTKSKKTILFQCTTNYERNKNHPPEQGKTWLSSKNICNFSIVLWLLVQVVLLIVYWDVKQRSDQGAYMSMATQCYENGVWYPTLKDVYSSYIWAPGLINYFILQLKIFGTLKFNVFLNLLMNIGILWDIRYIAKRFFGQRTAYIATTLFCLTYSNMMVVLPAGTEVPFVFLALTAFILTLQKNWGKFILAGFLFALANWIRPLVIIFLPASIWWMYRKKYSAGHYVALLLPFLLLNVTFGYMAKQQMGYFVYQSTTSGVNLIMTSCDQAYGGVATSLLKDSTTTCYIQDAEHKTFVEKDSIYKARSIEWIKQHPGKAIGLYAAKLVGLYVEDSWAERPIIGGDGFVDKAAHGKADKGAIIMRVVNMVGKSIVYYVVMLLFLVAVFTYRKEIVTEKGYVLIILLLGTLSTCLFSVSPRYHYPFMFPIILWAAYYLARRGDKSKQEEGEPC